MIKRNFKILLIACVSLIWAPKNQLYADTPTLSQDKKYNLSVCAIFKNEERFLREWIEYHRLIGVDHFYLYNSGSKDRSVQVLKPYIKEGIVTLINWVGMGKETDPNVFIWALSSQVTAYENAIKFHANKKSKWLTILNIDEYLLVPGSAALSDILEEYDEYPGITLVSDYFDASVDAFPKRKLLIQTTEIAEAPEENIQKTFSKTIFKPHLCTSFIWPPYQPIFKDGQKAPTLRRGELRINCYTKRYFDYFNFKKSKNKAHVDNRTLTKEELAELLNEGFEIQDQEKAIFRFVPELLMKMGFDGNRFQ